MKKEGLKTLPKEVQEVAWQESLTKRYPSLYMDRFIAVDTRTTRLAIDDISYRAQEPIEELIETIALACKGWVEIYDAKGLTAKLAAKVNRLLSASDPKRTLLVFPGNGSQAIRELLPVEISDELDWIAIDAERKINPKTREAERVDIGGKTEMRKIVAERKIDTIVVLDDTIVTGSTLSAVRNSFPQRGIQWFGAALIMLSPLQNRRRADSPSSLEGYVSILCPIVYQGTTGIPALNSLSTLVGSSTKSEIVREEYVKNYVEDEEMFLETVNKLGQSLRKKKP